MICDKMFSWVSTRRGTTEIVLKNVLRKSKNLPATLEFALQTIICDEIVSWGSTCRCVRKESPKTYSAGRKTPRYNQNRATNCDLQRNLFWASTCRGTLQQSSKTCSAGRKTPRYSQNRATNCDLHRNRLLSVNVSRYTATVFENVLSGSKNPQVQLKPSYKL